jgi:5'-nucleotidase
LNQTSFASLLPAGSTPEWSSIDTVLLDMDGTLLDLSFDNDFWRHRVPQRYAELHGLSFAAARNTLTPRFAARQGTLEWYCTDFWSRDLGFDVAALKHEVREHIRYLPGATTFLEALKERGKRLLLVTNAHHDSLRIKAGQTGLAEFFDQLISSHSLGFPKEHPQFWQALDARGVYDAERSLFVDDSLPVLRAARAHGVAQVFAVARPDSTAPPHVVEEFPAVHSVCDLLPELSGRGIF